MLQAIELALLAAVLVQFTSLVVRKKPTPVPVRVPCKR